MAFLRISIRVYWLWIWPADSAATMKRAWVLWRKMSTLWHSRKCGTQKGETLRWQRLSKGEMLDTSISKSEKEDTWTWGSASVNANMSGNPGFSGQSCTTMNCWSIGKSLGEPFLKRKAMNNNGRTCCYSSVQRNWDLA